VVTTYLIILLLAFLAGITAIIGVLVAFYFQKNGKGIASGIGFAIGMMLLISFFELIPEAVELAGVPKSLIAVIFGALVVILLDLIIPDGCLTKSRGKIDSHILRAAYLVGCVLVLHNFPEGLAITSSYFNSAKMGVFLALAIAIHNIPEGFAFAIPLLAAGKSRKFVFKVGLLSGLSEPIGAALGILLISVLPDLNPLFMAFAAGAMIFVSFHELLPLARRYKNNPLIVAGLVLSIIVYFGLTLVVPE